MPAPDIDADLADGRKIAVDLTSWLDESQIGREKKIEMIERRSAMPSSPEPANSSEHIFLVWLSPKQRMRPVDKDAFRIELLALVEAIDKDWGNIPWSDSSQGFEGFHEVSDDALEVLNSIDVHPRREVLASIMRKGGLYWLTFPARGGAYSPDWMVDALAECITQKTTKYSAKPHHAAEFHLLVHYDKAFVYNSPV